MHVSRRRFNHKYSSAPVEANLRVRKLVIGSQILFELTLSRPLDDMCLSGPPMMLVSDRNGRIRHLTTSLALALNSTPEQILTDGAARTIDLLIPEPYCTLHTSLMKVSDISQFEVPPPLSLLSLSLFSDEGRNAPRAA